MVTRRAAGADLARTAPDRDGGASGSLRVGSEACRHAGDRRGVLSPQYAPQRHRLDVSPPRLQRGYHVTPAFVTKKQDVARRAGARFGSVAFVTGHLDPVSGRGAFLALFDSPPVPILVFCGNATPPRSKAEMAVLAGRPGIDLRWVRGSLGLHEEWAETIADPIARFVRASSAEPTGGSRVPPRERR
jgi:hypothetical protein